MIKRLSPLREGRLSPAGSGEAEQRRACRSDCRRENASRDSDEGAAALLAVSVHAGQCPHPCAQYPGQLHYAGYASGQGHYRDCTGTVFNVDTAERIHAPKSSPEALAYDTAVKAARKAYKRKVSTGK